MARNPQTPSRTDGGTERALLEAPFRSLHREMNHLFDDIFHGRLHGAAQASPQQYAPILPKIDVSETDGEMRIRAELPGVNDSDIDVSLDGDLLVIRGEKRAEKTNEEESYHFVERSYGSFQRAVQLPCPVVPEKVRAEFGNGVLTVTLPKCEEPETTRKIAVQRAQQRSVAPTPEQPSAVASKARPPASPQTHGQNPTPA